MSWLASVESTALYETVNDLCQIGNYFGLRDMTTSFTTS
jgi:hypothetical protein